MWELSGDSEQPGVTAVQCVPTEATTWKSECVCVRVRVCVCVCEREIVSED